MATDVPLNSPRDSAHLMAWLEEQRRVDHAGLTELVHSVEQLRSELREHDSILARLTGMGTGYGASEGRGVYETLTQLKEHIALIERALEEHFEESTRVERVETVERDRETRQLATVLQHIEELGRTTQASQGRIAALAEELRHERMARAPIDQSLDELQRSFTSLQNRLLIVEDQTRRYAAFQTASEQALETQRSDLTRFDQQQKLLDLRVNRDVAEVKQTVTAIQARVDDHLKPVAGLIRQFTTLGEHLERNDQSLAILMKSVEALRVELGQVDTQIKTDRVSTSRLRGEIDTQAHRIDEVNGVISQLSERLNGVASGLQDLRSSIELVNQRLDRIERELTHVDEVEQQFDATLAALQSSLRAQENEIRVQASEIRSEFGNAVAELGRRLDTDRRTFVEHRRRTLIELQQQLSELDKSGN
ncbi:MAG TPA: hypothetical protein VKX96_04785 [Chloroflexota bacterium]|nr:hypothetical protein [Chloroflexota bacterium]